ncbi:PBSX family phage terminase large subunit [Inquilinus ginsengisoli]|uniref:PBSX family phage terminase large subunit n=1 Tax=Inquilinus ginsengisoli TaxID=363840 RepID=UPI003D2534F5
MKGTDKQLRFVDEILVDGYGNRAAIRAGYSPKGATALASHMLKDPDTAIAVFKAAVALRQDGRSLRKRVQAMLVKVAVHFETADVPEETRETVRELHRSLGRLRLPAGRAAKGKTDQAKVTKMSCLPADPPPEHYGVFAGLLPPARYKGAHGGRGSGKSHFFAELLVRRCFERPTRAVCIREVQRSLDQSVKRLIEDKILALGVGSQFKVQQAQILTPGGRIIFQGMQNHTAESIKSLEGYDIAWVEEAQSLSARSLDLLRPTIRKPGSELWFSWNPTQPTDPVDALFRGPMLPPDALLVEAKYSENPHFPEVLKAEMEWDRRRDPDKYQHVWLGGYRRVSEARVFKNWRVEAFETPADARFLLGADWGFSTDPTVLVRCFITGRTLFVDHEAYAVGCEIDRTPALFDTIPGARSWPITADSARPETINYLQRHGFGNLRAAAKGAGSVEEGVAFLQSHDILVHPRCRHLIDELALYSYRTDPHTGELQRRLEDRENHVIDALRYAVENQRRGGTYDSSMRWVGTLGWTYRLFG